MHSVQSQESDLSPLKSGKEEPPLDEENDDCPAATAPSAIPTQWGTIEGRSQRGHRT
jgi:hypothetical protein